MEGSTVGVLGVGRIGGYTPGLEVRGTLECRSFPDGIFGQQPEAPYSRMRGRKNSLCML